MPLVKLTQFTMLELNSSDFLVPESLSSLYFNSQNEFLAPLERPFKPSESDLLPQVR